MTATTKQKELLEKTRGTTFPRSSRGPSGSRVGGGKPYAFPLASAAAAAARLSVRYYKGPECLASGSSITDPRLHPPLGWTELTG